MGITSSKLGQAAAFNLLIRSDGVKFFLARERSLNAEPLEPNGLEYGPEHEGTSV